ncbi:cinnamyl alcohol dehydrogenase 8-like isoform X2 [Mizuhopecten yessoensis]|uniref:cinnamyl alcohol dehydrogenase 8-like isoform X2 n=2 Tax=Mizuhopecten yessoensis TaxID=6573 RepID=UPI000B457A5C|nr:cinnamyl alcohol dehydrogenase 8-like isoform X2 [Mizuhopecten yessoensis]
MKIAGPTTTKANPGLQGNRPRRHRTHVFIMIIKMLDNEMNQNEVMLPRALDSLAMPFESASSSSMMPEIPKGGLLVRVCYAGACYSEGMLRRKEIRPTLPGLEISGVVQDVCASLPNGNFSTGDKVVLYPDENLVDSGYSEYLAVEDVQNCLQIPENIPLEVAAMLPGGALSAYSALLKAKPHVEKLQEVKSCVNVLVVGAGGLGLWAVKLAQFLVGPHSNNIRLFVADNSIDKLLTAQDHGCYDIIHWNEEDHEQYIIERTLDACRGGVDVIVDFVSSPRTMQRSLKILNREGLILVGGNTMSEVSINLNSLAAKQQSIVGIPKGSFAQLRDLVTAVSEGAVTPPTYTVYPAEDAAQVFDDLARCRITGRAILCFGNLTNDHAMVNNN